MLHIKKIKPLFTSIITTGDKFEKDMTENGIITAKAGDLKLWQKVVAVGSSVRDIKVGDMVMINPSHYAVKKYDKNSIQNDLDNNPTLSFKFNWIYIDTEKGKQVPHLLLNDRDIDFVFEGEEKEEVVVIPDKSKIILS
jgi:co-chaperonin GroES (HSP10)